MAAFFHIAQELADAAVPKLADWAAVDVLEVLLRGEEPPHGPVAQEMSFRRVAFRSVPEDTARGAYPVGEVSQIPPASPYRYSLTALSPRLITDLNHNSQWFARDPRRARLLREAAAHSLIVIPLAVPGSVFGLVAFYRRADSPPFNSDDLHAITHLADRASLSLDTARRLIWDRTFARSLQRAVLPEAFPSLSAIEAAHGHVPQEGSAGEWFDVIPLSSARVALVVGIAQGRGVLAAANMSQLRAALVTLAALDLSPDEMLARLEDAVNRLVDEHLATRDCPDEPQRTGASCLCVIYDPVTGHCTSSRAGNAHLVIAYPDGIVSTPGLAAHPPLGGDNRHFEATELDVPSGATLVLKSGGPDEPPHDPDPAVEGLTEVLTRSGPDVRELLDDVLRVLSPSQDPALLLAHIRALDAVNVATRTLPPEAADVAVARDWTSRQLAAWTLDELSFATTLVVSELVTNAIRYSTGPVQLRLIHDNRTRTLICEVSDTCSAPPHLRQSKLCDEGGRGLAIVAQLTQRQGTRYTASGKTVWTEQPLPP
jgi:anti-sigma regulatory factor (Ser/Thr protein kinase)